MRFTMAKTQKQLDEILEAMRGEDLLTLRALDEKLPVSWQKSAPKIALQTAASESMKKSPPNALV